MTAVFTPRSIKICAASLACLEVSTGIPARNDASAFGHGKAAAFNSAAVHLNTINPVQIKCYPFISGMTSHCVLNLISRHEIQL